MLTNCYKTKSQVAWVVVVVIVLAFSDDPSSNLADVYSFSVQRFEKVRKINKNRPGMAHYKSQVTWKKLK